MMHVRYQNRRATLLLRLLDRHAHVTIPTSPGGPRRSDSVGLATVYSIVQCCGGVIDVESELGRGTTVTVLLPLVHAS